MSNGYVEDAAMYEDVEGLIEDNEDHGRYVSVFDFTLCQRSRKVVEGWEGPIKTTNQRTGEEINSYVKRYDKFVGRIVDFYKQTKEFSAEKGGGKVTNWQFVALAGKEQVTLQFPYMNRVLKRLLKVAPNVIFERPIMISAFKSQAGKQAVAFHQCQTQEFDKNFRNWTKVEEYWKGEVGTDGKVMQGSTYTGADGSVLPAPIYDESDDSWDFKPQERFLAQYFAANIYPKLKAIAATHNLNNTDQVVTAEGGGDLPAMSGMPQAQVQQFDARTRPVNPVATLLADAVTAQTRHYIIEGCKVLNVDPDAVCRRLVGAGFNEINEHAGQYIVHQLTTRIQSTAPVTPAPAPVAPAPTPVAQAADAFDPNAGGWEVPVVAAAPAPTLNNAVPTNPQTAPYDPNSNDDIPW